MASLQFDASTVAPAEAAEAIPAGWYPARMSASEMKPTANGQGAYLSCEYTILEGEYKGRKQFDRINLQNANPTAVEIGYRTLSAICHATGVIQVQDSVQLHGRPLMVKVAVRAAGVGADGKNYEASNEIKGYKAYTASQAAAPAPFAPPPMAPAPVAQQPWQQPVAPQAPAAQPWQQPAPQQFAPPAAPQPAQAPVQRPARKAAPPPQQFQAAQPVQQPMQQGYVQPPAQAPQEAAPMPPWAGQPAPVAQPNVAQPAAAAAPPWAQQPAQG